MKRFVLPSYAKLNLALKIMGRRPDGYHELVTLFERIDLHDDISFAPAPEGKIVVRCDDARVPCDERNLVWKVARLFMDRYKVRQGVVMTIKKRIPVAAGLAGGSSNAATALLGLNRLWSLGLSRRQLLAHAAAIGSDVAFFIHDVPFAVGTGRGEIITPVRCRTKLWHFLVVPKAPLLTRDVYGRFSSADLTSTRADANIMRDALRRGDAADVGAALSNDLEAPILALKPHLRKLKERVARQAVLGVAFSGSGPSVFSVVGSEQEALRLKKIFVKTYKQVFVARTK